MTATLELNSARRKLTIALGDRSQEYFNHMKAWFRKRCTKEEFDMEARKLLPSDTSHLHNEFLLAILNKCQTLVGFTTLPMAISVAAASAMSPNKGSSPGTLMSPNTAVNPLAVGGTGLSWKSDPADEGRLKYGPVKRKGKNSRPSFEQRFTPPALSNGLSVLDAGNLELHAEERRLGHLWREPMLPDISLLHGRMLISAWECGLENGVDDESVELMLTSVEQFLRNIITSLLMDRSGFRLRDKRLPVAVGNPTVNPWVLNSQSRNSRDQPVRLVADIIQPGQVEAESLITDDGDIIPMVPIGDPMLKDVEHEALVDMACASVDDSTKPVDRVSLFDLLHTMQKNRQLIPSHSVYAVNMDRLISRLHHPGRDE